MIYGRFLVCSRSVVFPRKREREKERERERERRVHVRTTSNANNMWQLYFVSIARRRSALEPKLPAKSRSWRFDKHHQKRVLDLTFSFGTSSKPQRSNGRKKPAEKKIVISNVKKKEFHPLPKLLNACPDFFFCLSPFKVKNRSFFLGFLVGGGTLRGRVSNGFGTAELLPRRFFWEFSRCSTCRPKWRSWLSIRRMNYGRPGCWNG